MVNDGFNPWAAIAPGWLQAGASAGHEVWERAVQSLCCSWHFQAQLCQHGWLGVRPGAYWAAPREQSDFPDHGKITTQSSLPSKHTTMRHLCFAAFIHLLQKQRPTSLMVKNKAQTAPLHLRTPKLTGEVCKPCFILLYSWWFVS